jgi:SAM-dependent methyltransferase
MTRAEKILSRIDKKGLGLEIGPSYSPIAPKSDGFHVHVIDHLDRAQLVEKYKSDPRVRPDSIEEVDFVWHGEPYAALTGRPKGYDWIIASHVIEHAPDLVGFLNNCDRVLKDTGVLSLAIPDLRYCFDHFRPPAGLARVIDAHYSQHTRHTPGTAAEATLNYVSSRGHTSWSARAVPDEYRLMSSLEETKTAIEKMVQPGAYDDFHAWCFTPHSFRLLVHNLHALGYIALKETAFFPTAGCEFFITLGRNGQGAGLSRLELMIQAQSELGPGHGRWNNFMDAVKRRLIGR